MKKYQKTEKGSYTHNERNDCGVRACSILARVGYEQAHAACKEYGRRDRRGMKIYQLEAAIKSLGCTVEELPDPVQPNGSQYTCKTIGKKLKRGYYLVYCKGHFVSVVNGVVEDWSHDTNMRVKWAWKVTKPRALTT